MSPISSGVLVKSLIKRGRVQETGITTAFLLMGFQQYYAKAGNFKTDQIRSVQESDKICFEIGINIIPQTNLNRNKDQSR